MKRLILKKTVSVEGADYFGRPSFIEFSPTDRQGWYWQPRPGSTLLPITAKLASDKPRRLVLVDGSERLEVWEHVGSLRFLGLDGIVVRASTHLPYFGRPHELWQQLKPWCEPDGSNLPWHKIADVGYQKNGNSHVQICPGNSGLKIEVDIDYAGLGSKCLCFRLPDDDLEQIFKAHTIIYPIWLYWPARLWLHRDKVNWPQNMAIDDLLAEVARHRLGDLLGALSLSVHTGLPAGRVYSYRAGHKLDLDLVKSLRFTE
jgi:hypothetical protein